MKKSFDWLNENHKTYIFHDYKKSGISAEKLGEWLSRVDVSLLINTKGTTFKKLTPEQQLSITNKESAIALMLSNPSMIKRPLIEANNSIYLGYKPEDWSKHL